MRMLRIEETVIRWIEKNLLWFGFGLVTILGLWIRRLPIWWNPGEIAAYFDLHENQTGSYFFHWIVRWVQFLPLLPVHSIKWLSLAGDMGVAVLTFLLVHRQGDGKDTRAVLCYSMCFLSPVLLLRGVAWAQPDSVAAAFFLAGWELWQKKRERIAMGFFLLSVLLNPSMLVCLFLFGIHAVWKAQSGEKKRQFLSFFSTAAAAILLLILLAVGYGAGIEAGVKSCFAWMVYDPVTGSTFATGSAWLIGQIICLGLPMSVLSGIWFVRNKKLSVSWIFGFLSLQLLVSGCYGMVLFR